MKKNGFTLAEVLITLGIIGVISALTLPALLNDTQGAQVGPRLGKAASMFEQANQVLLQENSVDSLFDGGFYTRAGANISDIESYLSNLSRYLKITHYKGTACNVALDKNNFDHRITNNGASWISKDGVIYTVSFWERRKERASDPSHKTMICYVLIDINRNSEPNLPETDVFAFSLRDDGSLIPAGAYKWNIYEASSPTWQNNCANNATPANRNYYMCTASIFENNMKVMYKMR